MSDVAARGDMRVEVVKRELNQGALAGFDSSVTEYAAKLVVAALDSFDEDALAAEFRRGFEAGELNAALLTARAERAEAAIQRVRAACSARQAGDCTYIRINDVLGALDAGQLDVPAPTRSGDKKIIECQLPVGWEWCALPIGHAGQCDPQPSPKEDRAGSALTRPVPSDAGLPADGEERK